MTMLGLGLDLAVNTGFALGRTHATHGNGLRTGCVRLKAPKEDTWVAPENLGCFLRDMFVLEVPDFIVYEAPLPFFAEHSDDRKRSFESLILPPALCGAVRAIARCYGVPCYFYQANTIRKLFLGRMPKGGREETKKAVINQCLVERLIPPGCKNDNIADAAATWLVGMLKHGGYRPNDLVMFGETPDPEMLAPLKW